MSLLLVLGAGRGGELVADILLQEERSEHGNRELVFLDDDPALAGSRPMGIPVLGPLERRHEIPHEALIVAIGDNRVRARLLDDLRREDQRVVNAIHPTVVVSPTTRLGRGLILCAGVILGTGTVLGDGVIVSVGSVLSHHVRAGQCAHIGPGVAIAGGASIGAGALVGVGARLLPEVSIGDWAVVGAGAVVARDVPELATVVGIPARSPLSEGA